MVDIEEDTETVHEPIVENDIKEAPNEEEEDEEGAYKLAQIVAAELCQKAYLSVNEYQLTPKKEEPAKKKKNRKNRKSKV